MPVRYRRDSPLHNAARPESAPYRGAKDQWYASITVGRALWARRFNERIGKMAGKTQNIEVKVDERLAAEITGKAVERWHATTFSNGKRKVYVTFEEVKTVG